MNINNLPEYERDQYYNLGSDSVQAQAGLNYLNSFTPVSNMERWADSLIECADGNYRVERLSSSRLNDLLSTGIATQQDVITFVETYVVSVDDYDPSWSNA